jgi:NADH-quinone oxidoreductase subunit N
MGLSPTMNHLGQSSLIFFLAGYAVTNLGAFIAVIALSNKVGSDRISDYDGMGKRAPMISLALTLCLISLTGIPPTAGFMAKFYIFSSAVQHDLLWLVIIAVLNSVISAYYYLRVVKVMWFNEPKFEGSVPISVALRSALIISCAGVIILGVLPNYAIKLAEIAAKMFAF